MLKYWEKRGEDAFVRAQDGGFINNKCLALKPKDDVIVPKVGFRKKRMKGKKGNEIRQRETINLTTNQIQTLLWGKWELFLLSYWVRSSLSHSKIITWLVLIGTNYIRRFCRLYFEIESALNRHRAKRVKKFEIEETEGHDRGKQEHPRRLLDQSQLSKEVRAKLSGGCEAPD